MMWCDNLQNIISNTVHAAFYFLLPVVLKTLTSTNIQPSIRNHQKIEL